ncbi:hypothetical protein CTI12_AA199140 [Artemisia annua]|uniref:Uncharacterized protein n=1 Tax=Artemisia annua TaxID=35608 RepID=A0A2U1P307_ARTAN|nr:hypothetical protein CTI12_AA199140 [Artemisia annua]
MKTRAVGGSTPFEEGLAARLGLFRPLLMRVQDFFEKRPQELGEWSLLLLMARGEGIDHAQVEGQTQA